MTKSEALALEEQFGGRYVGDKLDWLEVTHHNDSEENFLLLNDNCPYCGKVQVGLRCESCGAGPHDGA